MVPTRTGKTGKPGKTGGHFPVREISGNFAKTGKVRELIGKLKKILKTSWGNLSASNSEKPANMTPYFK